MGMRKYLIIIIVLSCFLFGSCGERCAKQIVPVQSRCSVKFENNEDGLPICQSCRHYSDTRFGRYSVVSVYDLDGKLVKEMSFEDYKKDEK